MNEGLASALVSERFGEIGPTFLHRWVRNNPGRVMALADLIDDAKWNSNSGDGYRSTFRFRRSKSSGAANWNNRAGAKKVTPA